MTNKLRPTSWRMLLVLGALFLGAMTVTACAQPIVPVAPAGTAAEVATAATAEATADARRRQP